MTEIFEIENNEVSQDAMPLLLAENAEDASGPPTSHLPHLIHDEEAEADAELERDVAQESDAQQAAPAIQLGIALRFLRLLFPSGSDICLRAIPEAGTTGSYPQNFHTKINCDGFENAVEQFLASCAATRRAAFVIPGTVTPAGTKKADVISFSNILADFDKGDVGGNLAAVEELIGPASIVVESGGVTTDGHRKAHAYWSLSSPATGSDIKLIERLREQIAARFGADTAFKQAGEPIRIPGSLHQKGKAKLVVLRDVRSHAYELADVAAALNVSVPKANDSAGYNMDFGADRPNVSLERVLTQPILAEGQSDDGLTRFDGSKTAIGHYVRCHADGLYSQDEARAASHAWNAAINTPPWDAAIVDRHFDRLLAIHIANHGPIISPTKHGPLKIRDWSMRRYEGAAPTQRWLVEGTFPLGEPGILAGDGGVGKSFLALDLCLRIATGKAVPPGALDFGRTEIFGGSVVEFGSAVFITAEESKEALHRRLAELDPHNTRHQKPDNLFVVSLRDRSGSRTLIKSQKENYAISDFARELAAELKSEFKDLRLVVLDPVSALFGDNLNDRAAVQALADVLSWIASETGATVIGLHHRRKDGDDGRKSILGSSGFVDAFRFAYILQLADKKEASKYAPEFGLSDEHGEIVVGELVKANGGPKGGEHIYERQPSGVLRQLPSRVDLAMSTREARLVLLVEAVDWYAEYGQPFTKTSRAGGSGVTEHRACLPPELRELSGRELQALVDEAVKRKELVTAAAGGEKRQQWLCRPGSNVAMGNLRAFTPGARPPWETRIAA